MGFVDYFRMGMGWWSNPPAAPAVIGSIIVGRVESVPSIVVDDYDLSTDAISIGSIEVIP